MFRLTSHTHNPRFGGRVKVSAMDKLPELSSVLDCERAGVVPVFDPALGLCISSGAVVEFAEG